MQSKAIKRQLLAAVAMVIVAAIALSSATYAWFAINSKVTATTTSFTTVVSNNLFIAEDTLGSTAKQGDANFKTALVKDNVTGVLEPVSTINGINYFYSEVTNVLGNGDTKTDKWVAYPSDLTTPGALDAFHANYSNATTAVGYVDYVYQLKAVNGTSSATSIKLTDLNMFYNKATDAQAAYRVAVFAQDITTKDGTSGNTIPAIAASDLKAIYTVAGAANFTNDKAVESTTTLGNVTYNGDATLSVSANTTAYYKIVIRVWLEGEDTTCNNTTFANLQDGAWSLSTGWTLGDGTAVTKITEVAAAVVDLTSASLANPTETVLINGVTYTKIDTATVNSKAIYTNNGTINSNSRIFTIDQNLYPTDVTNMVKLPTPAVGP